MSRQRKLDMVFQELEDAHFSPSSELGEKVAGLLKIGRPVLLFDPDMLVIDVASMSKRLEKANVQVVKGDLEFRKVFYSSSGQGTPLVIVDQSSQGVFIPDLRKDITILAVNVKSFIEEETGREWPPEVRNFPFKEVVRKRWKELMEIYNFVQGRTKVSLSHAGLRRIAASAVLRTNLFMAPNILTAWELSTQREEEWAELQQLFDVKEVEKIRAELQTAGPLVSQLADPKQSEIARKALAGCLVLKQYFKSPQEILPLLDPSFHPYLNFDPSGLKIEGDIPRWIAEEVNSFEESLGLEAWDILSQKLNLEGARIVKKILDTEKFSSKLVRLALLKAIELSLQERNASSKLSSIEIGLANEATEKLKAFLGSIIEAQTLLDNLNTDLRKLLQKEPNKIVWNEISKIYVDHSVYRLEALLWGIDRQSRGLRPEGKTNPSWVNVSVKKTRSSAKGFLKMGLDALTKFDRLFQDFIQHNYPLLKTKETMSTPQFIERLLLPRMRARGPERTVQVLLFDGMRFDLWREVIKPMLEERYTLVDEIPGLAMLPSSTRFSRKASFAGQLQFKLSASETKLLEEALSSSKIQVKIAPQKPPSKIVSHALRTEDGDLSWTIVDLTDKLPHNIPYHLDSIFNIVKGLEEELRTVFNAIPMNAEILVLSDHGFSRVGDEAIRIEGEDVSMHYAFVDDLPNREEKEKLLFFEKERLGFSGAGYVVFPRIGYYLLKRDADRVRQTYCHGGISLGEMLIPFAHLIPSEEGKVEIVIRAKTQDQYTEREEGHITLTLALKGIFEEEIELNSNIHGFKSRRIYLRKDVERPIDITFTPAKPGRQTVIFEAKKEKKTLGRKTIRINVVKTGKVERLGEEKIKKLFEG